MSSRASHFLNSSAAHARQVNCLSQVNGFELGESRLCACLSGQVLVSAGFEASVYMDKCSQMPKLLAYWVLTIRYRICMHATCSWSKEVVFVHI